MATPRKVRLTAVLRADELNSSDRAAAELGLEGRSIRRWQADPELAEIVRKTREAQADDIRAVRSLAWALLAQRVADGNMENKDLINLGGVAFDKVQMLDGEATTRTETRDLTGTFDDGEREALRKILDEVTADAGG